MIIALSLVALMGIAALAIDGGLGFSTRRSTQNAADAAALAGAEFLNTCVTTGCTGSESGINTAVQTSLSTNHVDTTYTCELVDSSYWTTPTSAHVVMNPCPTNGQTIPSTADGVLVTDSTTNNTTFGNIQHVTKLKAGALAVAQLEKVTVTGGSAPFFACGVSAQLGGTDPAMLIADAASSTGYDINPAALASNTPAPVYNVWGPHVPLCDSGNGRGGFHGIVGEDSFTLPSWITDQTGVRAGPTRNQLSGPNGCGTVFVNGCRILLPICINRQSQGNGSQLYCVMMGEFELVNVGTNSADAELIGGSSVLSFGNGGGQPGQNDFRVIRITL